MNRSWYWKAGLALTFTLAAVWFVLPNFLDVPEAVSTAPQQADEKDETAWYWKLFPKSRIRLGLDLRGGIHMVLGIDLERAVFNEADRYASDLEDFLKDEDIEFASIERPFESTEIKVTLKKEEDQDKFEDLIRDRFNVLQVSHRDPGKGHYILGLDPNRRSEFEQQTIGQALETLRNRLDEFGVAEPSIQSQGKDRIVVQLPGLEDPERAKNVLGRTAQLEFKIVDDESLSRAALENLVALARKELSPTAKLRDLNRKLEDRLPPGTQVFFEEERDPTTNQVTESSYLLKAKTLVTGDMLDDARITVGEFNQPEVALRFNPVGTKVFDEVTDKNIGKRLAIVLDDKIQSAPVINSRISDGNARITFGGLRPRHEILQEAKDLALVLRAGALPAPVEILETRSVGPSLGRDSVENGLKAILVGVFAIMIFMALYYQLSGIAADFALITNILFILACLGGLHATLTLPGIAGILISIGMAVDANVIIYERIREELRVGKPIKTAIELGYDRAHVTILDSNLTTLIAGFVLLEFGTGPIKGFAITLIFGLIANYFTALWFTRLAYEWILTRFEPKRLSI